MLCDWQTHLFGNVMLRMLKYSGLLQKHGHERGDGHAGLCNKFIMAWQTY